MTRFIKEDGTFIDIEQDDLLKCPHVIMMPEHYRDDGTCRCNDPTHTEMAEWGYMWDGSMWKGTDDETQS